MTTLENQTYHADRRVVHQPLLILKWINRACRVGRVARARCARFLFLFGGSIAMICPAILEPPPCAAMVNVRPNLALVNSIAAEPHVDPPIDVEPGPADNVDRYPQSDYPEPKAIADAEELAWDLDTPLVENAIALGKRLSASGDLYRTSPYGGGLMLASSVPNIPPMRIVNGNQLAAIIADRIRVQVYRDGKPKGCMISSRDLDILLQSEAFLQQFRPVDQVTRSPFYLPDFKLTVPGYNNGGRGHRVLYVGTKPAIKTDIEKSTRFLDTMDFASVADRTNAVAAALTVLLRNHFPGGKPLLSVMANKSHAGKDTIIVFAGGLSQLTAISYQRTDWALERSFVGAVKHSPSTGVVNIENARLGNGDRYIASAFLERFLCDPEPTLFSTGSGGPVRRVNDLVVAISTNYGSLSTDLLNRCLPIHLELVGDVTDRQSPIGNPKVEFLPRHAQEIQAELRGMVERWKEQRCPLDTAVRHPFSEWAAVTGGILKVNGFEDFLANYAIRRSVDDPLRDGLALLGAAQPGEWLPPAKWARLAEDLGLVRRVIPRGDQDSEKGRERGIGLVLTGHVAETFHAETDSECLVLRLEKARRRFDSGAVSTRYQFHVFDRKELPAEAAEPESQVVHA